MVNNKPILALFWHDDDNYSEPPASPSPPTIQSPIAGHITPELENIRATILINVYPTVSQSWKQADGQSPTSQSDQLKNRTYHRKISPYECPALSITTNTPCSQPAFDATWKTRRNMLQYQECRRWSELVPNLLWPNAGEYTTHNRPVGHVEYRGDNTANLWKLLRLWHAE